MSGYACPRCQEPLAYHHGFDCDASGNESAHNWYRCGSCETRFLHYTYDTLDPETSVESWSRERPDGTMEAMDPPPWVEVPRPAPAPAPPGPDVRELSLRSPDGAHLAFFREERKYGVDVSSLWIDGKIVPGDYDQMGAWSPCSRSFAVMEISGWTEMGIGHFSPETTVAFLDVQAWRKCRLEAPLCGWSSFWFEPDGTLALRPVRTDEPGCRLTPTSLQALAFQEM